MALSDQRRAACASRPRDIGRRACAPTYSRGIGILGVPPLQDPSFICVPSATSPRHSLAPGRGARSIRGSAPPLLWPAASAPRIFHTPLSGTDANVAVLSRNSHARMCSTQTVSACTRFLRVLGLGAARDPHNTFPSLVSGKERFWKKNRPSSGSECGSWTRDPTVHFVMCSALIDLVAGPRCCDHLRRSALTTPFPGGNASKKLSGPEKICHTCQPSRAHRRCDSAAAGFPPNRKAFSMSPVALQLQFRMFGEAL